MVPLEDYHTVAFVEDHGSDYRGDHGSDYHGEHGSDYQGDLGSDYHDEHGSDYHAEPLYSHDAYRTTEHWGDDYDHDTHDSYYS